MAGTQQAPAALQLLHRFDLRCAGTSVDVGRAGARLLAFLALSGLPAGRGHVAAALWPDSDETRAMGSVRSALWRIRREAPSVLVVERGDLALGRDVEVDVTELARFGRGTTPGPPPVEEVERLATSVRGSLLPDWDDEWLAPERERVRQLRLHTADRLVRHLSDAGRHVEALDLGRWLTSEAPFRETAHAALARALVVAGNRAEAVAHVRIWTERFQEELGIDGSPALRAALAGTSERG